MRSSAEFVHLQLICNSSASLQFAAGSVTSLRLTSAIIMQSQQMLKQSACKTLSLRNNQPVKHSAKQSACKTSSFRMSYAPTSPTSNILNITSFSKVILCKKPQISFTALHLIHSRFTHCSIFDTLKYKFWQHHI